MNTMHSKNSSFAKKGFFLTSMYCILLFSTLANAQVSKLNKTEFVFGNGSGWESIGTESTPSMRAKKPVMLRNGQTIEDVFSSSSATFYQQFTNPREMTTTIKDRMLGMITSFAYVPDPSTGWLVCDGTEYSTASYQRLANLLRNTYGGTGLVNSDGDWAGTFKVPDLRGIFIMGSVSTSNLTTTSLTTSFARHMHPFTSQTITLSSLQANSHRHGVNSLFDSNDREHEDNDTNANMFDNTIEIDIEELPNNISTENMSHRHQLQTGFSMSFTSVTNHNNTLNNLENRPINAAVVFCIFNGE